jgi:hypothetical protein
MTTSFQRSYLMRIELWHTFLLLVVVMISQAMRVLEPTALLLGGVFMGLNFILMSLGICWILSPTATKKRQRVGVILLVLKLLLFLGLVSALFFRMELDGVSFVVGVSSLLVASIIATLSSGLSFRAT